MKKLADHKNSKLYAKISSLMLVFSMVLTYIAFIKSNTGSQSTSNWGFAATILMLLSVLSLSSYTNDVYWVRIFKKEKLDERQLLVKRKIIQRAYSTLVVLIVIALTLLPGLLLDFQINSDKMIDIPYVMIIIYMLALPSIFAAWEKDA